MTQPQPNEEQLSAYLDHELSPEERALVEQRLATDADYAATLADYRQQRETLRGLPKTSIDVRRHVMEAIDPRPPKSHRPPRKVPPVVYVLAALAAMLLVALFVVVPQFDGDTSVARVDTDTVKADADSTEVDIEIADVNAGVVQKVAPAAAAEVPLFEPGFSPHQPESGLLSEGGLVNEMDATETLPDDLAEAAMEAVELQAAPFEKRRRATGSAAGMSKALAGAGPSVAPQSAAASKIAAAPQSDVEADSSGFFSPLGSAAKTVQDGFAQPPAHPPAVKLPADVQRQRSGPLFAEKTMLIRPGATNSGSRLSVDQFKLLAKRMGLVVRPEVASLNMTQQSHLDRSKIGSHTTSRSKKSVPAKLGFASSAFLITATGRQMRRFREALQITSNVTELDSSGNLNRPAPAAENQSVSGRNAAEGGDRAAEDTVTYRLILEIKDDAKPAVDAK